MKKDITSKPNVFMFSAIEGFVSALDEVASKLPYNIFGLQCTEDAPTDSMASMAKFFVAVRFCNFIHKIVIIFRSSVFLIFFFFLENKRNPKFWTIQPSRILIWRISCV